jgi:oligopeptide transport system ATP-binding protein
MSEILSVENLRVSFNTYLGAVQAVRGVDLSIHAGESVAIVGESGCGKSVTARAIMGLLGKGQATIQADRLQFGAHDLMELSQSEFRRLRGPEMSMVFQDPMTSLNPTMRIGAQVMEGLRYHRGLGYKEARQAASQLLHEVGIPQAETRLDHYPHQYSGGMRQRVMLAVALACQPKLIFADEPTTALDVTIQAQILRLLKSIQEKTGSSIALITHDLGVVASFCDRVIVMYAGKVVETATVEQIFQSPQHPYTQALLAAVPHPEHGRSKRLSTIHGAPPNLRKPPTGCAFHPRCPVAMEVCKSDVPPCRQTTHGQRAACWLHHPHAQAALDPELTVNFDPWTLDEEPLI